MFQTRGSKGKIKDITELLFLPLLERGTMIWTNGCFDILHKGHVRHLEESAEFGNYLVVGVNSDSSVRALKGEGKPKMPEDERAEIVASLGCVDYVLIFSELSPVRYIKLLQPDVYSKGGEYNLNTMNQEERKIVDSYGGRILFTGDKVNSSTEVINRIKRG